jgi:hypothetical protein
MLTFWHVQIYYHLEISRGKAGVGKYNLKRKFSSCSIEKEEIPRFKKIIAPEEVVNYLRAAMYG